MGRVMERISRSRSSRVVATGSALVVPLLLVVVVTLFWVGGAVSDEVERQPTGQSNKPGHTPAYFYLPEGDEKCFTANAPEDMPLTTNYDNRDGQGVSCSITYKDPKGHVVFSRQVTHTSPKGKVSYYTKRAGDYKICIGCPTSQWMVKSKSKWSLSIELGDSESVPEQTAKKENFDELENRLSLLLRRLDVHSAENLHLKVQEEVFFRTSESINWRFITFAVIKIIILITTTVFSVYHLTKFFKSQKVI